MPKLFGNKKQVETKADPLEALVLKERLRVLKKSNDGSLEASKLDGVKRSSRKKTYKVGEIFITDSKTLSCLVNDFSDTGMRLELTEEGDVPDTFRLRVPTLEFDRRVTKVWQSEQRLGVTFD